jgi:hypothetical protein
MASGSLAASTPKGLFRPERLFAPGLAKLQDPCQRTVMAQVIGLTVEALGRPAAAGDNRTIVVRLFGDSH